MSPRGSLYIIVLHVNTAYQIYIINFSFHNFKNDFINQQILVVKMKNDISGGTAFIIFWIIIIIIAAIVIGLNKITQSDYGLALLIFPIIAFIAIALYRGYRKNLNKKEQEARIKGEKFNKPTVVDDSKTGLLVLL